MIEILGHQETFRLFVPPGLMEELRDVVGLALAHDVDGSVGLAAATALVQALLPYAKPDRRLPTAAQIKYALDLGLQLGLEVPAEALRNRGAMGAFLSLYGTQRGSRTRCRGD